jgi:uncharacterized protein (TIGR02594 family)
MPKLISATYHPNIEVAEFICDDGRHLLRSGGTLPWRINNPGNLTALMVNGVPAPKKAKGYIGFAITRSGRTFLIFPDEDSGRQELRANLKRMHGGKTIPETIPSYAPKKENNTEKYINDLLDVSGIPADKKIVDCNAIDLEKIVDGIAQIEGYHGKPDTRKETWVVVSTINATNGSQPLPETEIVLQVGKKEKIAKADATGRFEPIIHPADKTAVQVKIMDAKTGATVKLGTIEGATGKDFNLLSKSQKWKGAAGSEKINSSKTISKKPIIYVVQPGDSLWKIAKLYRTSPEAIIKANSLSDDKIYPGEVIAISGQESERPAPENSPSKKPASEIFPAADLAIQKKKPRPAAPPSSPAPSATQSTDSTRSKEGTGKVLALINPSPGRAPWMHIAIAEAKLRGGETELTLQDKINYHQEINDGFKALDGNNNAWCAAFVNWCLLQAKYPIDNPSYPNHRVAKARAHGFYEVDGPKEKKETSAPKIRNPLFVELEKPIYGAIAMVTSKSGNGNHVGFVYAWSGEKEIIVLGGNQNQRINFSEFSAKIFKSYQTTDKKGKSTTHRGSSTYLKYFVPIAYYEQAKKDLLDPGLENLNADNLNKIMGIKNEKPKKNTAPQTR